jgi:protein-tyrosine phosphatase
LIYLLKTVRALVEFFRIVQRRLQTQGLRTTLKWLYTVGVAKLTGRVSLRYSQITPNLYIGPQFGRWGKPAFERAGIDASLNLRAEFDDELHGLALSEYSYLPTEDNTAPSIEHLEEGVAFIDRVIANGGNVYVHCGSGVGRAPTMAAAYLVANGLTVDEALARIQHVRPFVRILPAQLDRLHEYAQRAQSEQAQT